MFGIFWICGKSCLRHLYMYIIYVPCAVCSAYPAYAASVASLLSTRMRCMLRVLCMRCRCRSLLLPLLLLSFVDVVCCRWLLLSMSRFAGGAYSFGSTITVFYHMVRSGVIYQQQQQH